MFSFHGKPHFVVWRKKYFVLAGAVAFSAAILAAVNVPAAVSASVATRQLPIYCVERDQKVCSISFDAAWGDGRVRQLILSQILDMSIFPTSYVCAHTLKFVSCSSRFSL